MKIKYYKILILLPIYFINNTSYANPPPYSIDNVKEFSSGEVFRNFTKYKIVLSDSDNNLNTNTTIKNITLCSKNKCYNSPNIKNINIKNMLDGKPNDNSLIYLIPRSETIESVYFEPIGGSKDTILGNVKITNPSNLNITTLPHNIDIFINLNKKNNIFSPYYASSMFNTPEAINIFYDKNIGINSDLHYKTKITIPKNALPNSQIFNVFANNDGNNYPSIDIYPNVKFQIPISLKRKFIDSSLINELSTVLNVKKTPLAATIASKQKTVDISENIISLSSSGFVSSSNLEQNKLNTSSRASEETCGAQLTRLRSELIAQTSSSGVVKIDYCTNKPPYIHIALINKLHKSRNFMIEHEKTYIDPFDPSATVSLTPLHKLDYLNNLAPSAIVSMNGFTWEGAPGTIGNTGGRPKGYVSSIKDWDSKVKNTRPIGINRKMGGTVIEGSYPGSDDGLKFIMHHKNGSPTVVFSEARKVAGAGYPLMENVVSTSTSILKNNVCNTGNTDRWSTVGATDSIMLMISSTSSKESNSADLCEIFRAFGITNALRLDGGGSTAMIINNKLLNPNTGSKRIVFGEMRHIPYSLKIH